VLESEIQFGIKASISKIVIQIFGPLFPAAAHAKEKALLLTTRVWSGFGGLARRVVPLIQTGREIFRKT
jgi:hypothetical protein